MFETFEAQSVISMFIEVSWLSCYLLLSSKETTFFLKKDSQPRLSSAAQHVCGQMYCVHICGVHVYSAVVDLNSSSPPGACPTPGLSSSISSNVRVCTCVYTHTPTHHHNTHKKLRNIQNKPSISTFAKHSSPRRQQAPDMDKLAKTPLPTSSYTCMLVSKNPVIHTHLLESIVTSIHPSVKISCRCL